MSPFKPTEHTGDLEVAMRTEITNQTVGGAASRDHGEDRRVKGLGLDQQERGIGPNVVL